MQSRERSEILKKRFESTVVIGQRSYRTAYDNSYGVFFCDTNRIGRCEGRHKANGRNENGEKLTRRTP